ncbi:hypothetical protein [Hyalangium versicolor]|uniref:hypothetical protein n=1 Tax=Hyalangium versicolor TaxID=2861190 RepID=UPI001CCC5A22|nr:hypothetical protein [Hyalangium versicolor]
MPSFKNLLFAALAASLFFSASEAEARFGKSSRSDDSEKKEEKKEKKKKEDRDDPPPRRVHDASAVAPSRYHEASPVGSSRPRPPPPPPEPPRERVIVVEPAPTYYVEPAPPPSYYVEPAPPPPSYYVEPAPVVQAAEVSGSRKDTIFSPLHMGFEGGPTDGGSRVNLFLALEGERLGLDGRLTGLSLATDDGSAGRDEIATLGLHLTYAIVAQEKVRLRLEGGFTYAEAPELKVFGPSIGGSFEGRLSPHLDFEMRLQATPFPYRQVDGQAALALKYMPFAFRAGWRTLLLNDAGYVDGVEHQDIFNGPFLGMGLFF